MAFASSHGFPKDNKEIEDFIDKLLTSDKFEKLADRIAEKAADKLVILQHTAGNNRATEMNDPPPPKRIYDSEEKKDSEQAKDDKNSKDEKNSKEKVTKHNKSLNEKNDSKLIIDKEKMKASATIPTEELSLNYKHFTTHETHKPTLGTAQSAHKYTTVSSKNSHEDDSDDDDDRISQARERHHKKQHKTELDEVYQRVHPQSDEDDNADATKDALVKSDVSIGDVNETSNEAASGDTKTENSESDSSSSKFEVKTEKATTKKVKHHKVDKKKKKKMSEKGKKKDKNVSKTDAKKNNEVDAGEVSIADTANNKEDNEIDFRHMVREENGKLYKFEQSPDYEEYHEKLSKLLKNVQDKNKRRFNIKFDI